MGHNAGGVAAAHRPAPGEDLPHRTAADPGRPGGPIRDRRHSTPQPAICDPNLFGLLPDTLARDQHRGRGIHSAARNLVRQRERVRPTLSPRDPGPRRRRQLPVKTAQKGRRFPSCAHFMFKSSYLMSQIDTRRHRFATATSAPATAPRSAAGSGGSRFPARRRSRRAAPRPRRTACRRSGRPGAIRSRTRSAPTSPAIR